MGPTLTLAARAVPSTCVGAAAAGGGGVCLWLRHCEGPPTGGRGGATWEEGAEVALSLAERAAPSACVCVLRGGGRGAWVTNNIAKERDGWCARGEGCAHGCWEGGGGGRGRAWTYSAAVLPEGSEFGPEAHSTDGTVGIRGEC